MDWRGMSRYELRYRASEERERQIGLVQLVTESRPADISEPRWNAMRRQYELNGVPLGFKDCPHD